MASIKRREDGVWRARYRDAAGKEHARHFTRKVDAQRWLDETTAAVVTGQYVDPRAGKTTVGAYAARWPAAQPGRPKTVARVDLTLRVHVLPAFGDRALASIRPTEVQAWVKRLPLAPSAHKTRTIPAAADVAALAAALPSRFAAVPMSQPGSVCGRVSCSGSRSGTSTSSAGR